MRVEVGGHFVETTDGRTINVNQDLSREQADLLVRTIDAHMLSINIVDCVEIHEGQTRCRHLVLDDTGRMQLDDTGSEALRRWSIL